MNSDSREVLVEVTATAKNNTDRKVREGLSPTRNKNDVSSFSMGNRSTLSFPRIQGADVAVPSDRFHHVPDPDLADAELAALGMCSDQTAYHMLTIAVVTAGERVLVSGASGGAPIDAVMDLVGAGMTDRFTDTMTFDMPARTAYPRLSIAGGGNVSEIMWTKIYLYQVQIFGVSHGTRAEAEKLIDWIYRRKLKPVLHGVFRLSELHAAERYFANRSRSFLGKIVIVPDSQWAGHGARFAITEEANE